MITKKSESPAAVNKLIKFESKPTMDDLLNISNKLTEEDLNGYIKYNFKNIEIIEFDNNWFISILG